MDLPPEARELVESAALAHLATANADGSPQLSVIWVGLEDGEIVSGHMLDLLKLRNVRRDPRVVLTIESPNEDAMGLREYLRIRGTARITEGGAADLIQRLARVYMGPNAVFPPESLRDRPGYVLRITPERLSGIGPWA